MSAPNDVILHVGGVIAACNAVGYVLSAAYETHKLTDLTGAGSFVVAAIFLSVANNSINDLSNFKFSRVNLVNLGVMIWGTRLSLYLFHRVLQLGEDKRLNKFYREKGEPWFDSKRSNYPIRLSFFWFLQALWGFLGMLPVTFLNSSSFNLKVPSDRSPFALAAFWTPIIGIFGGILLEAVADYQKSAYRNNQKNAKHWCDEGLFSLSRYPNYFGEILCWWSIYLSCLPSLSLSQAVVSLLSPVFTTFLLLKVSGIPLLEKKNKKLYGEDPDYVKYVKSTNLLVPFPKF